MKFLKRSQINEKNVKDNSVAVEANGKVVLDSKDVVLGSDDSATQVKVNNNLYVTGNTTIDGKLTFGSTPGDSISVAADFTSDLIPKQSDTFNLGIPDQAWNDLFVNKITNTVNKDVVVDARGSGKVDILSRVDIEKELNVSGKAVFEGDLVVTGIPYGTAPIVTNTLYVTMDGDDTNDGSSMDPTRACRTIGGAIRSPLYRPGTSIKVFPGRYLENNPLRLKPYTSVIGSDLRTTTVEPINKTQDLFHVDSSTYLAQMQFINGRSGIIDPYIDRGAYTVAFPTNTVQITGNIQPKSNEIQVISISDEVIPGIEIIGEDFAENTIVRSVVGNTIFVSKQSLNTVPKTNVNLKTGKLTIYKSPYIQNCTNQSGPWLKDGTMFIPNQTVQLPLSVGITTFTEGLNEIEVEIKRGDVPLAGMSINTAPQDIGFFDARTLLLANKPFIQEQVLAYVETTYPTFVYAREKCRRDVGIIVENVLYDACFGGNSKSVESGLAYFDGVTSLIPGEESVTVDALDYIKTLATSILQNNPSLPAPDLLSGTGVHAQVFNPNLTDGLIALIPISNNIDIITNIITNGPGAAPKIYYSTGAEFGLVCGEVLIQDNREFIIKQVSSYVDTKYPGLLTFDQAKCSRDVGIILNSVLDDLILGTNYRSLYAGIAYTRSYSSTVTTLQKQKTIAGLNFARDTAVALLNPVTKADTIKKINELFKTVTDIIDKVSDFAAPDLEFINPLSTSSEELISTSNKINASRIIIKNKPFLVEEVIAWINKQVATNTPPFTSEFTYNISLCRRDTGYIIDALVYDLLYGGNSQSVEVANAYYLGTTTYLPGQIQQAIAAYEHLKQVISSVVQNIPVIPTQGNDDLRQYLELPVGTFDEAVTLQVLIDQINIIIEQSGTVVITMPNYIKGVNYTANNVDKITILTNLASIQTSTLGFLNEKYDTKAKCERDLGYIIDSISQDILLGGNKKSAEAGRGYYSANVLVIEGEATQTIDALNYAKGLMTNIVQNIKPDLTSEQVTNTYYSKGEITVGSIVRNTKIITDIIENGEAAVPEIYQGTALFAATGVSADDVQQSTKVTSVTPKAGVANTYIIGLDKPTVGIGTNSRLYFGYPSVYPLQDKDFDNYPEWDQRKYDKYGSMGGLIIDGDRVSDISPIRSMVVDAFTQLNQGGRGARATNRGYTQLVSMFTVFCSISMQVDNGGIMSITNANSNFGDYCMVSKGYGPKEFSGTIYNPANKVYNSLTKTFEFNQFYPDGYFPRNQQVCVFVPDAANRPHIGLVMEVIPPDDYINEQNLPGYITSTITTSEIIEDSLTISGIEVNDMYIGQHVYVRDQFGSYSDPVTGERYLLEDTVITDVGPDTIYLNTPVNKGGSFPENPTYFTIFVAGKAYYTILSSEKAPDPVAEGLLVFPNNQKAPELLTIEYIRTLLQSIVSNTMYGSPLQTAVPQVTLNLTNNPTTGTIARTLLLATIVYDILDQGQSATPGIVKKGFVTQSDADASELILLNINFIVAEISKFMDNYVVANPGFTYNKEKCLRDSALIPSKIAEDLTLGGNYNAVYSGLSYYARSGTYHLINLEDNTTNTSLFPDGAIINFYQRSYMTASGYLFEYVGAGSNYGALPMVGRADPKQEREVNMLDGGKVFFTSTDQNGDFRIGEGLVINQATGTLTGRTFEKSLFATMTPFILSIE
jgi:hypothetical protein